MPTSFQQMPTSSFSVKYAISTERVMAAPPLNKNVSDSIYLNKVIEFLKLQRKTRGFTCDELNQKARLPKGFIQRAESKKQFPKTREFKEWCTALGFKWEDIWTLALLNQMQPGR